MTTTSALTAFQKKAISGTELTLTFGNKTERKFDAAKVPGYAPLTGAALDGYMHGWSQKIGDTSAKYSKERDFAGALAAVDAAIEHILAGKFNAPAAGPAPRPEADLIAALAAASKVKPAEAQALWAGLSDEVRKAVAGTPEMKAALAKLDSDRAQASLAAAKPTNLAELLKAAKAATEAPKA